LAQKKGLNPYKLYDRLMGWDKMTYDGQKLHPMDAMGED
jgi:hypothetical protein